jgi:hypothetical protein
VVNRVIADRIVKAHEQLGGRFASYERLAELVEGITPQQPQSAGGRGACPALQPHLKPAFGESPESARSRIRPRRSQRP